MSPRLTFALEAAHRAGRQTLGRFQTGLGVEYKDDRSPVTAADRDAEALVRAMLAERYPGEAILGEEEGGEVGPDRWVLDPIDGTKSFICGVPLYATLLSFEEQGQPIVGVAFFPALNEMLYAERGGGAFLNGSPVHVADRSKMQGGVICSGSHESLIQTGRWAGYSSLASRALTARTWGDAYGHALVASGRAHAMLDPIVSRWDLSAISVIVREAGGMFTRFDGGEPLCGERGLEAISCPPGLQREILEAFKA